MSSLNVSWPIFTVAASFERKRAHETSFDSVTGKPTNLNNSNGTASTLACHVVSITLLLKALLH